MQGTEMYIISGIKIMLKKFSQNLLHHNWMSEKNNVLALAHKFPAWQLVFVCTLFYQLKFSLLLLLNLTKVF